ncbi:uncharacterized protein LOC105387579 isoform X2 [Plutella xylostella]|uniref:uncharacterized protein LOC105387579 isoform X2 n=1 Tax=Plutella xylostella TaxID=51655 RepID=UPI0020324E5A|nr:uncharacterized protein LOC105387579 isoform X2 [Plutella xylostella]
MDHIREIDWCYNERDSEHFLTDRDIDNSCTERILRNRFTDPLLSSDSEDETRKPINWSAVFSNPQAQDRNNRTFVPGFRPVPHFPKLSALSQVQHFNLLKVLCSMYPDVLEAEFIPRPTKLDHRLFEDLKDKYEGEQKEFKEWARALWTSTHCIRALRPKPLVEMVYDAEFRMKVTELASLPKKYDMAAQIPLVTQGGQFELVHKKDLIKVNLSELPQVQVQELFTRKTNIMRASTLPEPCARHPCRLLLPNETSVSVLPYTEVQHQLCQYAGSLGARFIVSGGALPALACAARPHALPAAVHRVPGPDGEPMTVVCIGSDFSTHRESSQTRTYKAFKHLLQYTLVPPEERQRIQKLWLKSEAERLAAEEEPLTVVVLADSGADSGDDEPLVIDMDDMQVDNDMKAEPCTPRRSTECEIDAHTPRAECEMEPLITQQEEVVMPGGDEVSGEGAGMLDVPTLPDMVSCSCEDSSMERPPLRSYRRWQVVNKSDGDSIDLIVHCSHKLKGKSGELLVEPSPEYQLELGAARPPRDQLRALALALCLRRNATLMNVRVDGTSGDLVTCELATLADLTTQHPGLMEEAANIVYSTLNHLQGLLPGQYLLKHEPEHGQNALLYVATSAGRGDPLTLQFDMTQLAETDEAKCVKRPPDLAPVLLPMHKFRRILPLAFSPFQQHVAKETKKPPARQKTPPQAIKFGEAERSGNGGPSQRKWPKRKKNKKKK